MFNRVATIAIGATVLGLSTLPRPAAAQFYDEAGRRPFVLHTQDDIQIDGDRARVAHSQDLRGGVRGYDGPVVYDERDPYRHRDGWRDQGFAAPPYGDRRPAPRYDLRGADAAYGRPVYGAPAGFGGYGGRLADGPGLGVPAYGVPYRAASAPIDYDVVGERSFGTDRDCLTEQSQSTTLAGWRKTVTRRTCYRR